MDDADNETDDGTALMRGLADGDNQAMMRFLDLFERRIYNFILRLGAGAADAEDLTAETIWRIYRHASEYVYTAKLTTFVFTVARNAWVDFRRRQTNRPLAELPPTLVAVEKSATADLEREETAAHLAAALATLPEAQRETVILAIVEDLPYTEVAAALAIPVGTVKTRVFYGLQTIRKNLRQLGYDL